MNTFSPRQNNKIKKRLVQVGGWGDDYKEYISSKKTY